MHVGAEAVAAAVAAVVTGEQCKFLEYVELGQRWSSYHSQLDLNVFVE